MWLIEPIFFKKSEPDFDVLAVTLKNMFDRRDRLVWCRHPQGATRRGRSILGGSREVLIERLRTFRTVQDEEKESRPKKPQTQNIALNRKTVDSISNSSNWEPRCALVLSVGTIAVWQKSTVSIYLDGRHAVKVHNFHSHIALVLSCHEIFCNLTKKRIWWKWSITLEGF